MPFFFSCSYSCCVVAGWLAQPFPFLSDCVFVILVSSVVASCSGKIQSVAVVKNCLLGVLFSCSDVDECEFHLLVFLLSVGVVVFIFQNFFAYVYLSFNLSHFLYLLSVDCHVAFDFLVSSFLYAFVEVVSSELDLLVVCYKISVLVEDVSYSCVLALSHEVELV